MNIPSYEELLERVLAAIPASIDKREGSLIYTAAAPVCAELAQMYLVLQGYYDLSFADTAAGEYLDRIAAQYGLERQPQIAAVWQAEGFDRQGNPISLPAGSRFSVNGVYLVADDSGNLVCEEGGEEGNHLFGEVIPVDYLSNFGSARLCELLTPGQAQESDDSLRERFYRQLTMPAFGGNVADYREKAKSLSGVGGVKVTPAFNGGGTVKLTLLGDDLLPADEAVIAFVKEQFDPGEGDGLGLAPIGHKVTVMSADGFSAAVSATVTLAEGADTATVQQAIGVNLEEYFASLRKSWEDTDGMILRISRIESTILSTDGVLDVENCTVNGSSGNLQLLSAQVPVFGGFNAV